MWPKEDISEENNDKIVFGCEFCIKKVPLNKCVPLRQLPNVVENSRDSNWVCHACLGFHVMKTAAKLKCLSTDRQIFWLSIRKTQNYVNSKHEKGKFFKKKQT